ncbi:HAMP domain-containing histidine kinase [Candidatus Sulfurimonas marisnigri]|uniref:histidine kinase n=1 Tax=Candidatus Sulfurimonas marisnigri TaxID=2740405 RepID=A0A7S7RQU2_9BACT|nr:HAMP domain-containing sensor histidine kinase [Candidatus Sulfurimonas marisnigri]QOY55782.1 HAMP domain-containing histidine kinase [Candidatus Sulfurimonas marisnigri]
MEISRITDSELLKEIGRRFEEKKASISEMEFMTKKLLELNEKNKNSQEVKSQFLSLIRNEFNNPMSSLLNITNMIVKKTTDQKIANLSAMMQSELLKLDFSLKNIFAASEIEAGETANDYSSVNIESIFNEKLDYFSFLIEEKSLKLKYIDGCKEKVISDSQKIDIILLNLISNACEYSYKNSEIIVSVECNDKNYIIKVEDSGEGVYEEHTKEIYNRFTHFETGNTRATAGLGLGLSVARGMVEALDGTIDNTIENGKTVFTVLISKIDERDIDISTGVGSNEFIFDHGDGIVEF